MLFYTSLLCKGGYGNCSHYRGHVRGRRETQGCPQKNVATVLSSSRPVVFNDVTS